MIAREPSPSQESPTPSPRPPTARETFSLYIHIPFCSHRCAYCDFNTYAGLEALIPAYVSALEAEMEHLSAAAGHTFPVHTVYFGGGTPSLLPIRAIERLLQRAAQAFALTDEVEITLEANPGTLTAHYLRSLRALGVNRLSLGVQSVHPQELRLLERQHDYLQVIEAVRWARQAGFENLSFDLIFGLPHQTLSAWQRTLDLTLGLRPEHLSLYALTIEHGTPFAAWLKRGLLPPPDPDCAADMYEYATEALAAHGYVQYEISNWARHSAQGELLACRHNLQYWRNQPYLGLGAGAHGYIPPWRTANVLSPQAYIRRLLEPEAGAPLSALEFPRTPATQTLDYVDPPAEIAETMMMGLRLVEEGISAQNFEERFGQRLEQVFAPQIQRLTAMGLVEWNGERLRLTPRGRLLGNRVFREFV